jgi:hypothetical protein
MVKQYTRRSFNGLGGGFSKEIVFILRVFRCIRPLRRFAGRFFLCLKTNALETILKKLENKFEKALTKSKTVVSLTH